MIASLLFGLGIVQMAFLLGNGFYRYYNWNRQVQQVTAQRDNLQQDVSVLQAVKNKADDPEYMLGLARCLGFVGADEKVLVATGNVQSSEDGETPAGNCETVRLP